MKRTLLLVWPLALLMACGSKGKDKTPPENADTNKVSQLTENDLFDFDKVADVIEAGSDDAKKDAKQKFLKAIDMYRNKKQPENALPLFRESLLACPTSKTYYEYGNALLDSRKYDDAVSAYHMAERLNYNPLSKVLYNLACAYSLLEKEEESLKYIKLAIQNGYDNRDHMLTDADLDFVRKSPQFKEVYETSYGGAATPEVALLDLFRIGFPETDLPYSMTVENSQRLSLDNPIAYDFEKFIPEMVDASFSREVGDEFFYVARLNETENYSALVYAGAGMWSDHPPVYYYLATYDRKKGKLIDHLVFGGTTDNAIFREGLVKSDLSVEVKEFSVEWKNDPSESGYENNKIVAKNLEGTTRYRIDDKGNILEAKGMLGMRR